MKFLLNMWIIQGWGLDIYSSTSSYIGSELSIVCMLGTLEPQLRVMMDNVDELNQESIKFNKHQNLVLKQYQEKTR